MLLVLTLGVSLPSLDWCKVNGEAGIQLTLEIRYHNAIYKILVIS
jgi:hypothetical protein